MEFMLRFFLSKNLRIARERAWELTVRSRGKDIEFWQPYVEEWQEPPEAPHSNWQKGINLWAFMFLTKRALLFSLNFYPIIGLIVTAWFKGVQTARHLHRPYFTLKKMDDRQVAVFMEERKWDYRAFGFAAALVESIPLFGLVASITNRVGAAMWAHDLEKRQHMFRSGQIKPLTPREDASSRVDHVILRPEGTGYASDVKMLERHSQKHDLTESWEELANSHVKHR